MIRSHLASKKTSKKLPPPPQSSVAEKWEVIHRPKTLENFYGQTEVKGILKTDFNNSNIVRSLLITGPAGCGKTTLARIIANQVNKGSAAHSDISEYNASSSRGIEFIRELESALNYLPSKKELWRVAILDEVHQLTSQAMSAFLKPLEEPPGKSIIILCTNRPEKLPDEIRQRCKRYQLSPLDTKSIVKMLGDISKTEKLVPGNFTKFRMDAIITKVSDVTNRPRKAIQIFQQVVTTLKTVPYKTETMSKLVEDCEKVLLDEESKTDFIDKLAFKFACELYANRAAALRTAISCNSYMLPNLLDTALFIYRNAFTSLIAKKASREENVISFFDKIGKDNITIKKIFLLHDKLYKMVSEFHRNQETRRNLGLKEYEDELVDMIINELFTARME